MSQWFVTGEFDSPEPLGVDLGPETILLYGDTGSGKTTQIGMLAEAEMLETGKKTRIYTADPGGYRSIVPYVKLGVIDVVDLRQIPTSPWEWVEHATHGKVPVEQEDGSVRWELKEELNAMTGVYVFEGATAFSDVLLQDASRQAAQGRNLGGQPPNFRYTSGDVKWAGNSPSHFGSAQTVLTQAVQTSFKIPGAAKVVWTALMRRTTDETAATVFGPQFAGAALTPDAPRWFVYTFRLMSVPADELTRRPSEHRLYIDAHQDGASKAFGNSRLPLDADTLPAYIAPASIPEALRVIKAAQVQAQERIAQRLR